MKPLKSRNTVYAVIDGYGASLKGKTMVTL